ncbi:MAG: BMC domain-containing protein [Lachnospiraceae bacterium]|nr:BMC domain-containing protein [Lachnospiraceae bacterium]
MGNAVGILEVYGLSTAFMAADAGCKAADVRLESFDRNRPARARELSVPLLVTVKFRGSVAAVEAAVKAGAKKAESLTGVVKQYIIPNPTEQTEQILRMGAFDKR